MRANIFYILTMLFLLNSPILAQEATIEQIQELHEQVKEDRKNGYYYTDELVVNSKKRRYIDSILPYRVERFFYQYEKNHKYKLWNVIIIFHKDNQKYHQEFLYNADKELILYMEGKMGQEYDFRILYFNQDQVIHWKEEKETILLENLTAEQKQRIQKIIERGSHYQKTFSPPNLNTRF